MDDSRFDALTRSLSHNPTRRAALRLLVGGLIGALLARPDTLVTRAAQRSDRDGDGLFDDDEEQVYFTNPDLFDTDGDGTGDGEEIYNRDNGLGGPDDPLTPDGGAPAPVGCPTGLTDCGGVCVDLVNDRNHCGRCGAACAEFVNCWESNCGGIPDPPPPPLTCAAGLTDCNGACVDVATDPNHCGLCGWACGGGDVCMAGFCTLAQCPENTTRCGDLGLCFDLDQDAGNCGACGHACAAGLICCTGSCVDISNNPQHCGGCWRGCFTPIIGDATCENYRCT
jgi:hypothetical protein